MKDFNWIIIKWWLIFIPLNIFAFITAPIIVPLAILCEDWKWNPFYWWLDDSRYVQGWHFAQDYEFWLDDRGGVQNFWNLYKWHAFRNTMWNLRSKFFYDENEYLYETIKNTLIHRGQLVKLSDDYGFIRYENSAGLKWINKSGDEGWLVNSGVKISWLYSIIGTQRIIFRVEDKLFHRYSTCFALKNKIFGKQIWITFKYGTGKMRDHLSFKIQWEK